ncbi:MAG: DinB family protein [Flavobacteriaceae bacterium]
MSWVTEIKENAHYRIAESRRMLDICLRHIDDQQLWERPNQHSNSVGNQLLHIRGNMMQYIWTTLGGNPDIRQRNQEFEASKGTRSDLWQALEESLDQCMAVIEASTADQLLKVYPVQAFQLSGIGLIIHAVEHLSYHTGQVAFWVKSRTDKPLGFYEGVDLNQKHQ